MKEWLPDEFYNTTEKNVEDNTLFHCVYLI